MCCFVGQEPKLRQNDACQYRYGKLKPGIAEKGDRHHGARQCKYPSEDGRCVVGMSAPS